MIHNTTWIDDKSRHWNQTENNTLSVPAAYELSPTTINNKLISVIHTISSTLDISSTKYMMLNICTDIVQKDTGAINNVTGKKQILVVYEDIEPYPIGGVKAQDVVIIFTGKGLLQWLSQEGKCTMVEHLYCTDIHGIIISPTKVVLQYVHL